MAETTGIAWTDSTFNPWIGCAKVSPGCEHCYAEKVGARMQVRWGTAEPRKRTSVANWREPLRWNERAAKEGRRHLVFCASLADVFDNEVPRQWRADLFDLILRTPALTWLLLTKRISNARAMLPESVNSFDAVYPNVWLGISVVNQAEADRDVPKLLATPAAKRFVSYEPALGPVDFSPYLSPHFRAEDGTNPANHKLDWIIVGGESGPKARPFDVEWARDTVRQCREAGVAVFVKQLGARPVTDSMFDLPTTWAPDLSEPVGLSLADKKGGDPQEWPEDLRVQEWPV